MKRRALLLALLAGCSAAKARHLVCEPRGKINRWGVSESNECHWEPGDAPGGVRTEKHVGDIERVQKYDDGSVRIDRYGMPGRLEEWHEISPGEWKLVN